MSSFWWCIGGLFIGSVLGYFTAALMFISRDRERKRRRGDYAGDKRNHGFR